MYFIFYILPTACSNYYDKGKFLFTLLISLCLIIFQELLFFKVTTRSFRYDAAVTI